MIDPAWVSGLAAILFIIGLGAPLVERMQSLF